MGLSWGLTPYTMTMGGLRGTRLQLAVASIATCAFWLFGYDMSVMGALITEDSFISVFPETKNANTLGIVIACLQIGALVGALACLDIGDRLGRRMTVFIGMAFMIVGGALQASAWGIKQMIIGRFLSGVGLGLQVATIPTWQSECSKPTSRGKWVMIEGGLQTTGVACGQWVGYGFFFVKGQIQWRMPVAIQLIPAAIVFCFIMFLPESPRWLIKKGKFKEGIHNLCALRGLLETDPVLIEERDSIMATYEAQKSEAPFELKELFQQGQTRTFWRVCIAVFIQAAQQLSGINLVSTYANQILATSFNLETGLSHLIAACGGTEYAICSILSVLLIEGLGRRKAFMYTATGMTICFIIIPILLSTGQRTPQLVAAGFLFLFNTFFGLAWVGGPFLYSAEIAPLRSRAAINGIASASNWIFCFLVVMTIPTSFENIGYKTYIVYAVLNACFVPIIYFFLVETKGRSLEELDVIFAAEGNPVWNEMRMEKHIDIHEARRVLGLRDEGGSEKSGSVVLKEGV
ncbi:general substrate transporter [Wilcoxina mikolae CBS 423.85]|nr:general substrate transporter [Wilcoxina mikolae CBS 423.85]